ncbi:P-loop containing nucleoside triphosphate hydrolase protein [Thamnocephalis sphaerospora]|uniref:P-loop containing nucleoside triphosphate hydrolase protein n=1 Tax=Thamnocephalis sphaerospora TaxID=78915 RepID=A0A4P9XRR8_9FUNG|nr:P-loop containing nucleoside triphosphate hydrolase protein [Thamnocephalis sphaerospora]|eukprot:RKP08793.1 P-loop containing nucleoside triphosphate hydrolase protein [Thamnocephalis sphaerospora]
MQCYIAVVSFVCAWKNRPDSRYFLAQHQSFLLGATYTGALASLVCRWACRTFSIHDPVSQYQLCAAIIAQISIIPVLLTRGTVNITSAGRIITLEDSASPLEWAFFGWMSPLFSRSNKHQLCEQSLWDLGPREKASAAIHKFSLHSSFKKLTMLFALLATFRRNIVGQAMLAIIWSVLLCAVPFFMGCLLQWLEMPDGPAKPNAWTYALGLFLCTVIANASFQHAERLGQHMATRARAIIAHEISQKCLHRQVYTPQSPASAEENEEVLSRWNTDAVIDLLGADAKCISEMFVELPNLVGGPIQTLAATLLLWNLLGPSAVVALATVLSSVVVVHQLGNRLSAAYDRQLALSSERVSVIQKTLQSICTARFFAWELQSLQRIVEYRQRELTAHWKKQMVHSANLTFIDAGTLFATCLCLGVWAVMYGQAPTASIAFTAVMLVSILRTAIWRAPQAFACVTMAGLSNERINEFLALPEVEDGTDNNSHTSGDSAVMTERERIAIEDADFAWIPSDDIVFGLDISINASRFALKNVSVEFQVEELNVVMGPPGSGKTSLLMALLEAEMPCVRGRVHMPRQRVFQCGQHVLSSNVAYVAQQAWLQNISIRDNITFGQPFDEERYRRVIHACALERDLAELYAGDGTLLGEKGIELNNDQKQRVALARAVYSPARHLILDDCLAAMDPRIVEHIVDNCLFGSLTRNRTRIIATSCANRYIQKASYTVLLHDGRVVSHGPTANVLSTAGKAVDSSTSGHIHSAAIVPSPNATLSDQRKDTRPAHAELTEEAISTGSYLDYIDAIGSYGYCAVVILAVTAIPVSNTLLLCMLRMWTTQEISDGSVLSYISILLVGCFVFALFKGLACYAVYAASNRASQTIHDRLVKRVFSTSLRAPNETYFGKIMACFDVDMATVDQDIPESASFFLYEIGDILCALLVTSVILPWSLAVFSILAPLALYLVSKYLPVARSLKRLESTSEAPFFSLNAALLDGATTIRAFGMEHWFSIENIGRIDALNRPTYLLNMASQWLFCRLQLIATLATLSCFVLIVLLHQTISPAAAGFVLVYALTLPADITWLVITYSRVESAMHSVQRISKHLRTEQEPTSNAKGEVPSSDWPQHGEVQIVDLSAKYAHAYAPALTDLTFSLKSGESVGVIDCAGMSSIPAFSSSFLKFTEPAKGRIIVDGVDIGKLGLHSAHSLLTIIPQDPVLSGDTVRDYLDPLLRHSNAEIWDVLRRCHLYAHGHDAEHYRVIKSIDTSISQGCAGFSRKHRLLLVLARAILRNSKVIIMDEAAVWEDPTESTTIQEVLRQELRHATLLCFTSHPSTVVKYDRVLVLDAGRAVEYGPPSKLIERKGGVLRQLYGCSEKPTASIAMTSDISPPPSYTTTAPQVHSQQISVTSVQPAL